MEGYEVFRDPPSFSFRAGLRAREDFVLELYSGCSMRSMWLLLRLLSGDSLLV